MRTTGSTSSIVMSKVKNGCSAPMLKRDRTRPTHPAKNTPESHDSTLFSVQAAAAGLEIPTVVDLVEQMIRERPDHVPS